MNTYLSAHERWWIDDCYSLHIQFTIQKLVSGVEFELWIGRRDFDTMGGSQKRANGNDLPLALSKLESHEKTSKKYSLLLYCHTKIVEICQNCHQTLYPWNELNFSFLKSFEYGLESCLALLV